MKVVFRCDASHQLGTGHVMRCLTLANVLKQAGHQCLFIILKHKANLATLISQDFQVLEISHPQLSTNDFGENKHLIHPFQQDWQQCQLALETTDFHPDWLVVDHYSLDHNWEFLAKESGCKLMVIDDLVNRPHLADILLDQTLNRQNQEYGKLVPKSCRLLTGIEYALLRPEFYQYKQGSIDAKLGLEKANKLVINLGGADNDNHTLRLLKLLQPRFNQLSILIVVGNLYQHLKELKEFIDAQSNADIKIKQNVSNMAKLLSEQHLAIGAAGTSCWERICLGLPSLLVVLADNQNDNANELNAERLSINLGSASQVTSNVLLTHLDTLLDSLNYIDAVRRCSQVQFSSPESNILPFLSNSSDNIKLQAAQWTDCDLLLNWRNDSETRKASLNSQTISVEEHQNWFKQSLQSEKRQIYIASVNGISVGMIRADNLGRSDVNPDKELIELSWLIAPEARGKGLATPMLKSVLDYFENCDLLANIKPQNQRSIAMVKNVGFLPIKQNEQLCSFVLFK